MNSIFFKKPLEKDSIIEDFIGKYEVKLNSGAQKSLSEGNQMTTVHSIKEYVNNACDNECNKIKIYYNEANNILRILSKENSSLDDINNEVLFNIGKKTSLRLKKGGVGKYGIGLNNANAQLIENGTLGYVIIGWLKSDNTKKGYIQCLDYRDIDNYDDKKINDYFDFELEDDFNFLVEIRNCKKITQKELIELKIELGLSYNKAISKGTLKIKVQNNYVIAQDRLYSKYQHDESKNIKYYPIKKFSWQGDDNAVVIESCDLSQASLEDHELIDYDSNVRKVKNFRKGVNATRRCGFEVAINDVTIINDYVLEEITKQEIQPSISGFRGRININNIDFGNKFIQGGNKSMCVINKDFVKSGEIDELVEIITKIVIDYLVSHKEFEEETIINNAKRNKVLDSFIEKEDYDCTFLFVHDRPSVDLFRCENESNKIIIVNLNHSLNIKENDMYMLIHSILSCSIKKDFKTILKNINNVKKNLVYSWGK